MSSVAEMLLGLATPLFLAAPKKKVAKKAATKKKIAKRAATKKKVAKKAAPKKPAMRPPPSSPPCPPPLLGWLSGDEGKRPR